MAIKSGLEHWGGGNGSLGDQKRRGLGSETGPVRKGESMKYSEEKKGGASYEREENRGGKMQPDRVRPSEQTMPKSAQQAQKGEYPWEVEGHSHNEVHDRQPHDGVNRQILEGQNFDCKELEGDKDLAYAEKHLLASKRDGQLPKGQEHK